MKLPRRSGWINIVRVLLTLPAVAALLLMAACSQQTGAGAAAGHASPAAATLAEPIDPLARLMAGNERFVHGQMQHMDQSAARRGELVAGQHPFAVIVSCSDSRVPPAVIFDQGLGRLFVVRLAGEVVDPAAVGSVEYAVEHLHVHLIMVLGHDQCGAVKAAMQPGKFSPDLNAVVSRIEPAVAAARGEPGDMFTHAIDKNAELQASILAKNATLAADIKAGKLKIVAARYELASGKVLLLTKDAAH